jgi:hypothetical protein
VGFLATLLVAVTTSFASPAPAGALPPGIPSASTAQSQLNGLTVRAEGSMTGYSRDRFPHWITISGACNTRETVLRRDGTNVTVNTSCYPTSGSWYSHYDGITETSPAEIDIDHVVPLAEAWRSGASSWTTSRRQAFANSLDTPQLLAVTDNSNQTKGDRDPSSWQPSRTASAAPMPACGSAPSTPGVSPSRPARRPPCSPCSTPADVAIVTELVSTFHATPDGVMTDEVGVITGDLELRSTLRDNGDLQLAVRYAGAAEWYTLTGSGGRLYDPRDLATVHHLLATQLSRPPT